VQQPVESSQKRASEKEQLGGNSRERKLGESSQERVAKRTAKREQSRESSQERAAIEVNS
jgi:hypothetical protein